MICELIYTDRAWLLHAVDHLINEWHDTSGTFYPRPHDVHINDACYALDFQNRAELSDLYDRLHARLNAITEIQT